MFFTLMSGDARRSHQYVSCNAWKTSEAQQVRGSNSSLFLVTCRYNWHILPATWLKFGGRLIHGILILDVILRTNWGGRPIREIALYASISALPNNSPLPCPCFCGSNNCPAVLLRRLQYVPTSSSIPVMEEMWSVIGCRYGQWKVDLFWRHPAHGMMVVITNTFYFKGLSSLKKYAIWFTLVKNCNNRANFQSQINIFSST